MSGSNTDHGAASPSADADEAAVTGFLTALAPGLGAVVAVSRSLPDEYGPGSFVAEWS